MISLCLSPSILLPYILSLFSLSLFSLLSVSPSLPPAPESAAPGPFDQGLLIDVFGGPPALPPAAVSLASSLEECLNIQAKPIDSTIENGAQVQQVVNVECN